MQLWIGPLPHLINPQSAISHLSFHHMRHVCKHQSVRKLSSNSNFILNSLLKIKKSPIWLIKHFPNNLAVEINNKIEPNQSVVETTEFTVGLWIIHSIRNPETPDGCSPTRRPCLLTMLHGTRAQPAPSTSPHFLRRMPLVEATCTRYHNLQWGGSHRAATQMRVLRGLRAERGPHRACLSTYIRRTANSNSLE